MPPSLIHSIPWDDSTLLKHVVHHFTHERSCLLQSGALPGRYGFRFLFLPPSAPLESSSAGSRSRLESDFASQSSSSASAKGRESTSEWQAGSRESSGLAAQTKSHATGKHISLTEGKTHPNLRFTLSNHYLSKGFHHFNNLTFPLCDWPSK